MAELELVERTETTVRTVQVEFRVHDGVDPMLKHQTKTVFFQPTKVDVTLVFDPSGSSAKIVVSGPELHKSTLGRTYPAMAFFDLDTVEDAPPWLRDAIADLIIDEHSL